MIACEETIMSHITIKNEPGTLVKPGTDEVTVKPEHEHNMTTSFWSLTKAPTIKTEHPLINQTLLKAKDEVTDKYKYEQGDRLYVFSNTGNGDREDTSSVKDSGRYTSTEWFMDKDDNQDEMIKAEFEQPRDVMKTESDHGMVDQESELMICDVQTRRLLLPKETAESSFVNQGNIDGEAFKCHICGKAFTQKGSLEQHCYIHTGKKPFTRHVCGKSFTQNGNIITHSRIHTGEKPFKCEVCGKSFTSKGNLNKHSYVHSGEKPFECEVCGKSFTQNGSLRRHSRIHMGEKPFKCEVCGKSFTWKDSLNKHCYVHTGDKPFKCQVCGNLFIQRSDLAIHSRIHTGEKPFKCDVCGKSFARNSDHKQHSRTHTGEKPFACQVCGKSFIKNSNLTKHSQIHSHRGHLSVKCVESHLLRSVTTEDTVRSI